jgi:mRNA interferase MazF
LIQTLIGNGTIIRMEIRRGDILLVNFEPVKGSEQGRIRPALIVQNNILNKFSPLTIVAPITSKLYSKEYPTNVFVSKEISVLNHDSTVLLSQIRTIDKQRIIKKICSLNKLLMHKINLALKITLGMD